ncbi:hypothetical protein ACIO8H_35860 [Streptomyces sp. NPDC087226]|uniref:hypothetical protein n=1 Tax=Streptomyces sp. NPDC087226 TaxID=3365771 RepID=UPI00381984AD
MTTPQPQPDWRPVDFDGLVVEGPRGERLLALPIAVLEILRYAQVIRFRSGGSMFSMRLDAFTDGRKGGRPVPEQPATPPAPAPSPTPPPVAEGDPLDPANIPMRVRRDGAWYTMYVTRAEYERYNQQQGHTPPPAEGNEQ